MGLPLASACAAAGNASEENNCLAVTTGEKDHGSDGLFQWRLGRLTHLKTWAAANELPWDTIKTQAWFFLYELQADYPALHAGLIAGAKPLKTLTANICDFYERPAPAHAHLDQRIKYAQDTLALMKRPAPPSPIQPGGTGAASWTGSLSWINWRLLIVGAPVLLAALLYLYPALTQSKKNNAPPSPTLVSAVAQSKPPPVQSCLGGDPHKGTLGSPKSCEVPHHAKPHHAKRRRR
ncbi:MAG: phage tail tip lysozyme [Methylocella sp.]